MSNHRRDRRVVESSRGGEKSLRSVAWRAFLATRRGDEWRNRNEGSVKKGVVPCSSV